MNPVVDEMRAILEGGDELMHYGMPRRSGRYPYGSGENPYQHSEDFLGRVEELRKQNFTYTDDEGKTWTGDMAIAKSMNLSSTQFRTEVGLAKAERRMILVARAKSLKADGHTDSEIGRIMGKNESSIRSLLNSDAEARMKRSRATADILKKRLEELGPNGMLDVGDNVHIRLNVSKEKFDQALHILEMEGYMVYGGRMSQLTNKSQFTTQRVLCPPGTEHREIFDRLGDIHTMDDYISRDGGNSFEKKFTYPESLDSKRLMIRYDEDGGTMKDGVVELRRNVADLSLGEKRFSQVRIMVDGTHYIKGMAVYSDDMPPGVDVIFNTKKHKGTPLHDVLKPIKDDPNNPFGSLIKDADQGGQYWYDAPDGTKKLGLINKRADEGDWSDWKDALPSQFLSKQSKSLAQKQLDLAKADKFDEYDAICSIENPTIKKHFLAKFADSCDAAAVNLQAAALPGQKYHVILPINSLKDNEVYAPRYPEGSQIALIRYPHGGTFEIPILTVTHRNKEARDILGTTASDGIGINHKVAQRLSGADFDGDTVMCIPTHDRHGRVKITSTDPLKGLEGFDTDSYGPHEKRVDEKGETHYYRDGREYRVMSEKSKGNYMGVITNLINDMTLAGASDDELAAATRHSMVIIDAPKHKLDFKQSEFDNNIAALHKKYQGKATGGAATIISRAKGQASRDKTQGSARINQEGKPWYDPSKPEGALIYKTTDDLYYPDRTKRDPKTGLVTMKTTEKINGRRSISYDPSDDAQREYYSPVKKVNPDTGEIYFTNKTGDITYKTKKRTEKTTKMAMTDDAYSLVSQDRHPMELLYADYANSMKSLANQARKELLSTGRLKYSPSAKTAYQEEVNSLMSKLNEASLNTIRNRAALRLANVEVRGKENLNPEMSKEDKKKLRQQAVSRARDEVGALSRKERSIKITDREWEAIQAGAISENTLVKILSNADVDELRQRATPRININISQAKINKIKAMSSSNYTLDQIAQAVGCSPTTVSKYLKGAN